MVILATALAVVLALPAIVLGAECLLALLPIRRRSLPPIGSEHFRLTVLIPAHDEEDRVANAVSAVRRQLASNCQVIVIADNCTDATASRARAAGATVWERNDLTGRGKAYALNFAFQQLRQSPPDVVIIVDADCEPGPACLETIARLAHHRQQPVQAAYMMFAPQASDALSAVSAFAVYIKNIVRPRGLQRIGCACLINGSGVAYPWNSLAAVVYPEQHLAEDYRFSTDLAVAGYLTLPCMEVHVESELPACRAGFVSQRTRWEQGHIHLWLLEPPRLLWAGIKNRSLRLWALGLELIVPPLSLFFGTSIISALGIAALSALIHSPIPIATYCGAAAFGLLGLATAWLAGGRRYMSPRTAMRIPAYIATKAPLYLRYLTARQRTWERTARSTSRPLALSEKSPPSDSLRRPLTESPPT